MPWPSLRFDWILFAEAIGWLLLGAALAIWRKPLAHWAIRRNPFWRNWPRAQAVVYQGTSLFLAATLVAYSLVAFYFLFVLRPSLERKGESLRQEAEKYLPRPSR